MTAKRFSQGKKRKAISRGTSSNQSHTGKGTGTDGKRITPYRDDDNAGVYWAKERKRKRMQVKLEGGKLFIALPTIDPPTLSRSGKSYLVATSGGVKRTPLLIDGAPVHVVVSAFVYGEWVPPVKWVPLIDMPKTEEELEAELEEAETERIFATIPELK